MRPRGVLALEMCPDRGRAPEVSLASSISIPTFLSRCLALTADSFLEVSLSDGRVSWNVSMNGDGEFAIVGLDAEIEEFREQVLVRRTGWGSEDDI